MAKLTDSRTQWMMRRKEEGRMTKNKIAGVYQITTRRLQQLWARYRSTGQMPTLHKPSRPHKPPDPSNTLTPRFSSASSSYIDGEFLPPTC